MSESYGDRLNKGMMVWQLRRVGSGAQQIGLAGGRDSAGACFPLKPDTL